MAQDNIKNESTYNLCTSVLYDIKYRLPIPTLSDRMQSYVQGRELHREGCRVVGRLFCPELKFFVGPKIREGKQSNAWRDASYISYIYPIAYIRPLKRPRINNITHV